MSRLRSLTDAFTDPRRRQRTIVILSAVVIAALGLYASSMIVTSQRWFCNDVCHNVHADNKAQYCASSHSQISCMACHYPVNMNPAKFALDRVDKLLDIYPTMTGDFPMPLNEYSRIALTMSSDRCTQCHATKRKVSPSAGMIIDHDVHAKRGINCTVCHNRVAHRQTTPLTLPHNRYAEDFMSMRACFRCHTLAGDAPNPRYAAPGSCSTCHTADFRLRPADHTASWMTTGSAGVSPHALAASADASRTAAARAAWAKVAEEFMTKKPRIIMRIINVDTERPIEIPPAATISECGLCHDRTTFCEPCHARSGVSVTY